MRNAGRLTMIGLLLCGVLVLAATSWAQSAPANSRTRSPRPMVSIRGIKLRPSATPGTEKSPDSSKLLTTWEWEPKTGKVTFEGKDKDGKPVKVTYVRSELSSQSDAVKNEVDPGFINDNYWLLFPFHAYWDTSATVTDQGMKLTAGGHRLGRRWSR